MGRGSMHARAAIETGKHPRKPPQKGFLGDTRHTLTPDVATGILVVSAWASAPRVDFCSLIHDMLHIPLILGVFER